MWCIATSGFFSETHSADYYSPELAPMFPLREVRRAVRCRKLRRRRKGQNLLFGALSKGAVFRRNENYVEIFAPGEPPGRRPPAARRARKHPKLPRNGAHGVVVSRPLSMREALGSTPSVSTARVGRKFGLSREAFPEHGAARVGFLIFFP